MSKITFVLLLLISSFQITAQVTSFAGLDDTICVGDSIPIIGISNNYDTLIWSTNGDGIFEDRYQVGTIYVPSSADYSKVSITLTLKAIDTTLNDTASDNVRYFFQALPVVSTTVKTRICEVDSLVLTETSISNLSSYSWSASDGTFEDNKKLNPVYIPGPSESNLLIITGIGRNGCGTDKDTAFVTIQTLPEITLSQPGDTVCRGESMPLTIADTTNSKSIFWTANSGEITFPDFANPSYQSTNDLIKDRITIEAFGFFGCPSVKTKFVIGKYDLPSIDMPLRDSVCLGTSNTLVGFDTNDVSSLSWVNLGDGDLTNTNSIQPNYQSNSLANDILHVTLVSSHGCASGKDTLILSNLILPQSGVPSDTLLCTESTITIVTSDTASYLWSNGINTNTFMSDSAGEYTVQVMDSLFCTRTDTFTLIPAPLLENYAGPDVSVCNSKSIVLNGAVGEGEFYWFTDGDGVFEDSSLLVATYDPGTQDSIDGFTNLYLISQNVCDTLIDFLVLEVDSDYIISAGPDQIICQGDSFSFNYLNATGAITWTTSGDGDFDDDNLINPIYTPGSSDRSNGFVSLTMSSWTSCESTSDLMNLYILDEPEVYAGNNYSICSNAILRLEDAMANGELSWTTSGTGRFNNDSMLMASYEPSLKDISDSSILLYLKSETSCGVGMDSILVEINDRPSVFAGNDNAICVGKKYLLADAVGEGSLYWMTAGDGVFSNSNYQNPVYTPGSNDAINGTVKLFLYSYTSCDTVVDSMQLTISDYLKIDAGLDQSICSSDKLEIKDASGTGSIRWTSSGTGTFEKGNSITPSYIPSSADIDSGMVRLVLHSISSCASVSDSMVLSILDDPIVDAGWDLTVCPGLTVELNHASANGSLEWTTSGSGTLYNSTSIDPSYAPGIMDTDLVILTLTSTNSCGVFSDDILISYFAFPVPFAGEDDQVCLGTMFQTNALGSGEFLWTSSGDGTFDNATLLDAKYIYGLSDSVIGSVKLNLEQTTSCHVSSDEMILLLSETAFVSIDNESIEVCQGDTLQIEGVNGVGGFNWISSGTGNFNLNNIAEPTYISSVADLLQDSIILTLVNTSSCGSDTDKIVLEYLSQANIDLGADQNICTSSNVVLDVNAVAGEFNWSSLGDGGFTNSSSTNTSYQPGVQDIVNGAVYLTLMVDASCGVARDTIRINISSSPMPTVDDYAEICDGSLSFQVKNTEALGSITWSTDGDGSFSSLYQLNPVYTLGSNDLINQRIWLSLSSEMDCGTFSDSLLISIGSPPISARPDTLIPPNTEIALELEVFNDFSDAFNYLWEPQELFDDPTIKEPVFLGASTSTFAVITMTSSFGCTSKDSVNITIEEGTWGPFLPTAFSPNGDGNNDVFYVSIGEVKDFSLSIYNRYSDLVFETNDVSETWDGTYHDKPLAIGTFLYIVKGIHINETNFYKKGKFLLIR